MAIEDIIVQIDSEIARLEEVKKLLSSTSRLSRDEIGSGRSASRKKPLRQKRTLSGEARKKIADAQRKRWAAQKAKK